MKPILIHGIGNIGRDTGQPGFQPLKAPTRRDLPQATRLVVHAAGKILRSDVAAIRDA